MEFIDFIGAFFDSIWIFFTQTLPQMLQDALAWFVVKISTAAVELKLWSVSFSWDIAQSVLDNLGVSDLVNQYIGSLSPEIAYFANAFGVFDAMNIFANALVTRFILNTTFLGSV